MLFLAFLSKRPAVSDAGNHDPPGFGSGSPLLCRGSPDPILTPTDVDARDSAKVAAVLFELAALGKSMSGDYEPAGSRAD